ncbi:MAG: type IV secretion system DNA-binding domain-containing protein, partial [Campylobacterales bacterium]|nr:type IV secretion system DNA-binding domain-containing protein [Campylobacterales bacterium]
ITSIESAKEELFYKPERVDPLEFISDKDLTYYGQFHNGVDKGRPFFLQETDTTHEIYVGSTGTGKGVLLGNKAAEAIEKKKGLIVIDPKKDSFLPQIIQERLARQGRGDDFQVVSWPDNFGYMGINKHDNYIDISNKLVDALNLEESENPGVDYYRKNSRVMLRKVLKLFFNGKLGVTVKKDFSDIIKHLQELKNDLEKAEMYEKELGKTKPNFNLLSKYEKRFYDPETIEAIYWDNTAVATLDSLVKSLSEIGESAEIYNQYTLQGALYEGKVLYIRVDMLDVASLKMVKMMITDAIQQARRKKANTTLILDELSFYANQTIAGALATVRSMGLKFLLALQDLSQMKDEHIRNAILSNCNVKIFYKISDKLTLEWVEKIGGKELVTNYATGTENQSSYRQATEDNLNATRIRALPRVGVGIVLAEALPEPIIVQTNYVAVKKEFDWIPHETKQAQQLKDVVNDSVDKERFDNYKVKLAETKKLLENSDLFGIVLDSEKL